MKSKTIWTIAENTKVPITVQHETALALFISSPDRLEAVWIKNQTDCGWVVRSNDGTAHGFQLLGFYKTTKTVNKGEEYRAPAACLPIDRDKRAWMLRELRRLRATRREKLLGWAEALWRQGKDLIRQSIPPVKFGDLEVDEGDTLWITFRQDETGLKATAALRHMITLGQISTSESCNKCLKEARDAGHCPTGVFTITLSRVFFNPDPERLFRDRVLPGLESIGVYR